MGLIITILAGAVIGWIASKIMGTDAQMGAIANIIAGIVGAAIGGLILSGGAATGSAGFSIPQFAVGILGACILIAIVKAITGGRRSAV
jgi:uncharacterized membrane protein YeaQ/YmgE (transglycosylase-associated protein family)